MHLIVLTELRLIKVDPTVPAFSTYVYPGAPAVRCLVSFRAVGATSILPLGTTRTTTVHLARPRAPAGIPAPARPEGWTRTSCVFATACRRPASPAASAWSLKWPSWLSDPA